ncbi:glycosyltransferase [Caldimonas tepidiphila]|uniref:glycosyltransferase n=1 Tax=Caldimonas tepidiphila TaxID=2315841 RepID=UPI000E5C5259|nr:glycosyltransferase [Caldimonas tepidiphila]
MKPLPEIRPAPRQRTRVLLLADEAMSDGAQRQIVHLARGLDRRRFEPTVLHACQPAPDLARELDDAGVPGLRLPRHGRVDPDFLLRLVRTLRAGRYDVMHGFALPGELWGAVARRFVPAVRRPVLLSSLRGGCEDYSPWQWRLKRWVSAQSRGIVANSLAAARLAGTRMGLPVEAVELVCDGVVPAPPPPQARQRVRQELGLCPTTPLALFAGRLAEPANLPTLLRAMQQLQGARPELRLAIAGDGPLRPWLEREIAALGLRQRVCLLGERADLADLRAAANFLVRPSLREATSGVVLEAMASGLPVIASRGGGNAELIEHERTGLLFDARDAGALARAMATLACDGPLRLRLAAAARARVQQSHGVASMVRAIERRYDAALDQRPFPAASLARTTG